jgi:hypothetical protein
MGMVLFQLPRPARLLRLSILFLHQPLAISYTFGKILSNQSTWVSATVVVEKNLINCHALLSCYDFPSSSFTSHSLYLNTFGKILSNQSTWVSATVVVEKNLIKISYQLPRPARLLRLSILFLHQPLAISYTFGKILSNRSTWVSAAVVVESKERKKWRPEE